MAAVAHRDAGLRLVARRAIHRRRPGRLPAGGRGRRLGREDPGRRRHGDLRARLVERREPDRLREGRRRSLRRAGRRARAGRPSSTPAPPISRGRPDGRLSAIRKSAITAWRSCTASSAAEVLAPTVPAATPGATTPVVTVDDPRRVRSARLSRLTRHPRHPPVASEPGTTTARAARSNRSFGARSSLSVQPRGEPGRPQTSA